MSTLKVNEIQNTSGGSTITNVGKVLQIVSGTKTDAFSGTSTSTPADITGLSVNITPSSASNKVWIVFSVSVAVNGNYGGQGILLLRDSTQICLADASRPFSREPSSWRWLVLLESNTLCDRGMLSGECSLYSK